MKRNRFSALLLVITFSLVWSSSAMAEALSLDQCLELAYRNSPNLESARQNIVSAQASLLSAVGSFLPSISSSAGYNHQFVGPKPASLQYNTITQEFFTQDPIASRDYETYTFSLSSDITLFSGFSRWARLSSQKLGLAAVRSDFETSRDGVESEVIRSYFDLVKAQMMVELNESSLESTFTQYEQSKRAFAMGAVARSDTLRSRVRYAEVQLSLLEAENTRDVANVALATLIGSNPIQRIEVLEPQVDRLVGVDRQQAIASALERNPSLKASEYRLEASRQGIRQAKAGWWPNLGAGYRYSWYDLSPPDELGQVFDRDYSYSLSLQLSWSLFDRFATKSGVDQARAGARVKEYTLEQQKRTLLQSIESTLVTLRNNRKRMELAKVSLELAREDLRLARERYRVGAAAILEVTEAEVSLVQARSSEINGITGYLSALAELERISGLELLD